MFQNLSTDECSKSDNLAKHKITQTSTQRRNIPFLNDRAQDY